MWTQLLFSTSLQVPGRMEPGEEELDVIGWSFYHPPAILNSWIRSCLFLTTFSSLVDLARSTPTPAATELLLSTILPTASLVCIALDFSFRRKGLLMDHTSLPALQELMSLTDTALRGFWNKEVHGLAPIVGKVGYLEGVSEKAEYIDIVADAILRVAARSGNEELRRTVGELEGSGGGVGKRTWRALLDVLKGKKGGVESRLSSLVDTSERVSENRVEEGFDDYLLFDEGTSERGSGDEYECDVFLHETDEEDERLFTWSDGSVGESEVDSIFNWADENECQEEGEAPLFEGFENPVVITGCHGGDKNILALFEELEGSATRMGYRGDEKNELLFMEDNELMLEDTALPRSEGEDMIWI